MPIRNAQPLTFRAFGVCDAVDATNVSPGAMASLKDLISNPANQLQFVPRPAATQLSNFTGFTSPAQGEALLVVGTRAYGMIASSRFAGRSEPFCYDLINGVFVTISNVTAANCPLTQSSSGDWTPPTMAMIANRIIITHPGYTSLLPIAWIDLRNFTSTTQTGTTVNGNPTITTSGNPLQIGWSVGDAITGAGIQANSYIVSMTATTVTLNQNCTAGASGVALTVTSGTTAAPMFGAGTTNTNALTAQPVSVFNFNNRAYYAVANGLQYADSLNPMQITNASQALTLGDNTAVTALGGLPLSNQVVGGVLQAMIAFKGNSGYWQITGDPATNNLAQNFVNGSVGTLSPNSLCGTPDGLAYVASDGLRIIDLTGKASDPIGANGVGITLPFQYAVAPTRICAAYNDGMIRISVQNGYKNGQPNEEYWYDMSQKIWTGPHSFPAGLIEPYGVQARTFVLFAIGIGGKLWQSSALPTSSSTYTENGNAMSWLWQTSLLPDNQGDTANQVVQSTLGLAMPAGQTVQINAVDENSNQLDSVALANGITGTSFWGAFTWGGVGVWGSTVSPFQQYTIPWHQPLVFKQAALSVSGASNAGFVIGNLYAKIQPTGYQGGH